jgi:hypothetical protein
VVAWLQVHVDSRSFSEFPRFPERKNFGVRLTGTGMKPFADNLAVSDNYRTDEGVGCGFAESTASQFYAAAHHGSIELLNFAVFQLFCTLLLSVS